MVTVDAANGVCWEVRRRWFGPRSLKAVDGCVRARRRFTKGLTRASTDAQRDVTFTSSSSLNAGVDIATSPRGVNAMGMGAVALVCWPLALLVEGLVRLVLIPVALVGHVVFRQPWVVEADGEWMPMQRREARGWKASMRARDELADELRRDASTGPVSLGV